MEFQRGDHVEIASKEEGFVGSFYAATVITKLMNNEYIVQYKNLLKDDESAPLREIVPAGDVRPAPPAIPSSGFFLYDWVDAFANDGWWVGKITAKLGSKYNYYKVFFETTKDEIAYPLARLRVHQDWSNGKWVLSSSKKGSGVMTIDQKLGNDGLNSRG